MCEAPLQRNAGEAELFLTLLTCTNKYMCLPNPYAMSRMWHKVNF